MTVSRIFPDRRTTTVHQDGSQLSIPSNGVAIILHIREFDKDPCCAEVISGEHYAEIGLSFDDGTLSDFDGVFFLPRELGEVLTHAGYVVPHDCFG
jgi:hypothetical protein